MKVPPKRKGNNLTALGEGLGAAASMKVPPKRKGNRNLRRRQPRLSRGLNESPSEKEGKY